jgi:hypothetical protein
MSRQPILLRGLAVVVVLGAAGAIWFARPQKSAVTLDVYGTSGVPVQGKGEVDGRSQELTGTVPTKFVLEGSRVTFTLTSSADSGEFRVKGIYKDKTYGSAGSGDPPQKGVRGWVKNGWGGTTTDWIEVFKRDADPGWLSPP